MMRGTIQKWGNSQAVRLPKGALQIARLSEDDGVEIVASEGQIVIRRAEKIESLDRLFAGYTGGYRPAEDDAGEPVGREVIE